MTLFGLRPLLRQRLVTALPPGVPILTAVSIEALVYGAQVAPAVYLIYGGGTVPQALADARTCLIRQTWITAAVTRHLGDGQSGTPAQDDAGALADRLLDRLLGWRPEGYARALVPADFPYVPQPEATVQILPVAWTIEFHYRAQSA